ncbi:MAG: hypothetical protein [Bacteriophage sp.]|nr:MAG: hypothetical protein [Bacteriophage sp.]
MSAIMSQSAQESLNATFATKITGKRPDDAHQSGTDGTQGRYL